MKRSNPFISPLGWGLSTLLIIILGITTWVQGGLLFSPGDVSAKSQPGVMLGGFDSHVDFEPQCDLCHQPLKTTQDALCLMCHENIEIQRHSSTGTHGKIENIGNCAFCHAEHKGRDFDPTAAASLFFDHSVTAFSLNRHAFDYSAAPVSCETCHAPTGSFELLDQVCQNCHVENDQVFMQEHNLDFGTDCLGCHDGLDSIAQFNHRATTFPLDGQHTQIRCAACHVENQFVNLDTTCAACHEEPDIHRNYFDLPCNACHTSLAWTPAILKGIAFSHEQDTSFSLARHQENFDIEKITCAACHPQNMAEFSIEQCTACHADDAALDMRDHRTLFGASCLTCHDGVDRLSNFKHNDFFTLDEQHVDVSCESCHRDQVFRGTASECWQCHAEPEIHAGFFGLQCERCHTSSTWHPARMIEHVFPLDHGEENQSICETCHISTYVEYTCYSCHEHKPGDIEKKHDEVNITRQELQDCAGCHPTGKDSDYE